MFISLPASNKRLDAYSCSKEKPEGTQVFTFTVAIKFQKLDKACSLTFSFARMVYKSS